MLRNLLPISVPVFLAISLLCTLPHPAFAWTINSNFEGGTAGQKCGGSSGFTEPFTLSVLSNRYVHSGSLGCQVGIKDGSYGWARWGGEYDFPTKLKQGDQVWMRAYVYFPNDFSFATDDGHLKTLRIHTLRSNGSHVGYFDVQVQSNNQEIAAGFEGVDSWFRNLGTPLTKGHWHALEMYVKFSATPGQGIFRVWEDGKLVLNDTKDKTLVHASDEANLAYLFSYWNGAAPKTQNNYIDDVVITTTTPANRDANGYPFIGLTESSGVTSGGTTGATSPPPPSNTNPSDPATPCNTLTSGSAPYDGFGIPWDPFSPTKKLVLNAFCTKTRTTLTAGNASATHTEYVWHSAYVSKNGTTWTKEDLSGTPVPGTGGAWLKQTGTASVLVANTNQTSTNYFAAYVCTLVNSAWQCGCANSSCSVQGQWQVQGFKE